MPDENIEYQRKDDVVIARVEQKLDDHIESQKNWNEDHSLRTEEWRRSIEDRIKPLEELNSKLKTPILVLTWLIGGPIALWLATKIICGIDVLWGKLR